MAFERSTLIVCEFRSHASYAVWQPTGCRPHGRRFDRLRIDVVGILYEGSGGFTIEHLRGVG